MSLFHNLELGRMLWIVRAPVDSQEFLESGKCLGSDSIGLKKGSSPQAQTANELMIEFFPVAQEVRTVSSERCLVKIEAQTS